MLTVRGRSARTAALVTPVMLATGLTTALLYLQISQQHLCRLCCPPRRDECPGRSAPRRRNWIICARSRQ